MNAADSAQPAAAYAQVFNVGSINIDHVYRVPQIVRPGETLASARLSVFGGGKGANQSVALARAGARVRHAGRIGADGEWLVQKLRDSGVCTQFIVAGDGHTGHAIIQVNDSGENAIVIFPGENFQLRIDDVERMLAEARPGDWLLLQNEVNLVPALMQIGARRGMRVCFNPAPATAEVQSYPLASVHTLILNRTEAGMLVRAETPAGAATGLAATYRVPEVVLTLGAEGAVCLTQGQLFVQPAYQVQALDTTGAGDTFTGYYLAERAAGSPPAQALKTAAAAAALCVCKAGAMDSIPARRDVERLLE